MEKHIEQAIREHIDSLTQDQKDIQILFECLSKKPRIELLKFYVELGLSYKYVSNTKDGILHVLAKKKKPEIMKMFIDLGANVKAKNNHDETPLHICTSKGDIKSMKHLIDAGADINAFDNKGRTPLMRACVLVKGAKATHVLLEHGADILASGMEKKHLGGHCIVLANNPRLITKELFDRGFFSYPDAHSLLPMHLAILHGYQACVETFTKLGYNLNAPSPRNGDTPLHSAIRYGKTEILTFLLDQNIDLSIMNDENETAIQLAERMQLPQVLAALRIAQKKNASKSIQVEHIINNREKAMRNSHRNQADNTSSVKKMKATKSVSTEEIREKDMLHFTRIIELMQEPEVSTAALKLEMREIQNHDIVDDEGKSILHHAAMLGLNRFVIYLIRRKYDTNRKDNINRTPLMYALLSGDMITVRILLDQGYDVHETDAMNNSLFVLAYWMEMYELASRFVREGADDRNLL